MRRARARYWLVLIASVASACARGSELEWMKAGPYTTAEFERDAEACARRGDLDTACMEARGWIQVHADPTPAPKKAKAPVVPGHY